MFEYSEQDLREAWNQNLALRYLLFPFDGSQESSLRHSSSTQETDGQRLFLLKKEASGNPELW